MAPIVEVTGLHKRFGNIRAVDGIDLRTTPGEIYGLLGPNGSGKTTLMRLMAGLLKATSGSVRVLGQEMPCKAVLSLVGYMTQATALYEDLTVRENVAFFAEMYGSGLGPQAVDAAVDLVGLRERANSVVRTLSGGMKQRGSLACALVHRPRLLLLDEPTAGVDPQLRAVFWTYFRQLAGDGVALVISSHAMDEAERCDRLGFLRNGKLLAEGSAAELRAQVGARTLEDAFLHFAREAR